MTNSPSPPAGPRPADSIRRHYEIERELAARLRSAPEAQRGAMYGEVYDELFRRVPDHPQLVESGAERSRAERVASKLSLVGPFLFPTARLLEIGCGDGAFAAAAVERVGSVVAVDVSEEIIAAGSSAAGVEMVLSSGTDLPVEPGSIDVVFSDQLMEHLHPDDAAAQLTSVAAALRTGGWYVLSTPNRWSGPHDISGAFDDTATGLHLCEYGIAELEPLLRRNGFDQIKVFAGGRGRYLSIPIPVVRITEALVSRLPRRARRPVARFLPIRAVLGLHLAARRA